MNNIKTITLDFWDTIFRYPFSEEIFLKRVDFTYEDLKDYVSYQVIYQEIKHQYVFFQMIWDKEHRTPTTNEMFTNTFIRLGIEPSPELLAKQIKFYEELILSEEIEPIDGVESILKYLSKKYKLVIISDTGFEPGNILREILTKFNFLRYFSGFVFSNEVGSSKPNENMFKKALSYTGSKFSESIHIGDRENKDIEGALNCGMKAILFAGEREDDFETSKATYKIKSWKEIYNLL
ncbi:MAG: HAD family hydrolase [Candidatus Delongbacteria bacterium]|nr:HAD family hydrolase [Candidatus Delongbacteria bacterium]MBN2833389.1 HAD family hydrolase [Candidatus Delongbacteria bacterium]